MTDFQSEQTVRAFMAAVFNEDVKAKSSFVTDDVVFVNGSRFTINGREEFEELFASTAGRVQHIKLEVRNVLASADLVMVERIDHVVVDGRPASLPLMGTFELRNGLISQWRDYFDPTITGFKREGPD